MLESVMGPRQILTLPESWEELAFQQDALVLDTATADLAPSIDPLLVRWSEVDAAQRDARRDALRSQVVLSDANYRLDAEVNDFAWDLERAAGGQDRPRFRRYFTVAPSVFVRRALAEETLVVRSWLDGIRSEPEPEVQRHAARLEAAVSAVDAATAGRATAKGAKADTSLKVVQTFLAEVNAFRMGLHGELLKRASASGLGRDWLAKFLRPSPRRPDDAGDESPDSPATTSPTTSPTP
jgi:hypothetical protein